MGRARAAPLAVSPRGTTPAPAYVLLADADLPPQAYAPWYAYDLLGVFGPSALGQAFQSAYGIAAPQYRGWASVAWPEPAPAPGQLVDTLVAGQGVAVDAHLLVVCLMTPAHSQIDPASNVLAYHSATSYVPYLWVPYYDGGSGGFTARDLLTFALAHEWMEAATDTWPGAGALPCGQEICDPCEGDRFTLAGSRGDAYLVQGFAGPDCQCWRPQSATWVTGLGPLGAEAFHLPAHLRTIERAVKLRQSVTAFSAAPPPSPP